MVPVSLLSSPFSKTILQEPMKKIKMSTIAYKMTDSEDHISAYEEHMLQKLTLTLFGVNYFLPLCLVWPKPGLKKPVRNCL